MRKTLSTLMVCGLSFALLGCPPSGDKKGTDTPPATDKDGDKPADGDKPVDSKPADGDKPMDEPADAGGGEAQKVDLSHVKVGQKYHYHMNNAGMEMDQVWEVTEMTDSEVKYNLTTIMNGKPLGEPTALSWSIPKPVASDAPADPNAKPPAEESITVAGKEWECWVIESAGTKSWCPKKGKLGTFPPIVKSMKGDQVTNELTKIEE
jgi:hypothetical protein